MNGLVLEGGGMRGIYTAGVLDCFLDHDITFDYVIGVSAGANMAASFLSKQRGRNKQVSLDFLKDKRYLSMSNYIKNREMFGMDFIFNEIPEIHVPFDKDEFLLYKGKYIVACTNCETGKTEYFDKAQLDKDLLTILRASSSLPLMAPIVEYNDMKLLDGGVTDPIPLRKAQRDGVTHPVVVLTRPEGYYKKSSKLSKYFKVKGYPAVDDAMKKRPARYNETLYYVKRQEQQHKALVIRPSIKMKVDRMEKNKEKLDALYQLGYQDALNKLDDVRKYISK